MPKIQVCHNPSSYSLFKSDNAIVVVIDILRATSAMVTAIEYGITSIIPVASVEEAKEYQAKGFLAAAERDGKVVEGFTIGNSPFCYMEESMKGREVVISTTNGTQAINVAHEDAHEIIIGSFLNLTAVVEYLKRKNKDVLFLCAGWKNKFNLEDTLFAGAAAQLLLEDTNFETECDSTIGAVHLFSIAQSNIFSFLENSSHRKRLKRLDLEADIEFCLCLNKYNVVPIYKSGKIVKYCV